MNLLQSEHICVTMTQIKTSPLGSPGGASGKEPACQCRRHKRCDFDLWVRKILWRRAWQPTPVFLPGESPWTRESDGLQSIRLQSQTWLKQLSMHANVGLIFAMKNWFFDWWNSAIFEVKEAIAQKSGISVLQERRANYINMSDFDRGTLFNIYLVKSLCL